MPAAMEAWRSSGGSSKEEQESGGTTGSGAEAGARGRKGSEFAAAPVTTVGSKRQRRPSVRLGEIGDLKVAASKSDGLSTVKWISPNFIPRKTQSGFVRGTPKVPRTRPLANVTHRGEIGQVLGSPRMGSSNDVVVTANVARTTADHVGEKDDLKATEAAEPPSTTGRASFGTITTSPNFGNSRKGKPGKRKRAASVRTSTIAKTIGVVTLNRKAKELQKVGYVGSLAPAAAVSGVVHISEMPKEWAELSGTQVDMEEDSGAARAPGINGEEEEQTENTVLLGEDGNGEDSSRRQEEDEPGSPGVRENQIVNANGAAEVPNEFLLQKDDRDQCTSRLTDGEKDRKTLLLVREVSMNGRRGVEARTVRGWLSSLGLDKYGDLFAENEVDNDVLHLLTFEDLKEMGIVAVGARRKMFAAIQEMGSASLVCR